MLEKSASFHAADGLAVCVSLCKCVCIDGREGGPCGLFGDVYCIGMSGVYLSMCPLILHFCRGTLLCECTHKPQDTY